MNLVDRVLRRFFPAYFRHKEEKETAEMRELGRKLLSEDKLKAVFPFFRIRWKGKVGRWSIRVDCRADACLLFNILPRSGKILVRYTAGRVLSSVKIDRKNALILEEYRCPSVKRWSSDGEEVRIARVTLHRGDLSCEILDFYRKL